MNTSVLSRAAGLSLLASCAAAASAQPALQLLGTYVSEAPRSHATAVSADGRVVVGFSNTGNYPFVISRAFRWTAEAGLQSLDPDGLGSAAYGVSADGSTVVGALAGAACRWTAAHGADQFLGPGAPFSRALAASADGRTIVGYNMVGGFRLAFRWTPSGGLVYPPVPEGTVESSAFDLTDDGAIVVGASGNYSVVVSHFWPLDASDPPSPIPSPAAIVDHISADGSVATFARDYGQVIRFDLSHPDQPGLVLSIPDGYQGATATGLSADGGVIIGYLYDRFRATDGFIWTAASGSRPIRRLLPFFATAGWTSFFPLDLSADGRTVVGSGVDVSGVTQAWRIVLDPDGPEYPVCSSVDFNLDGVSDSLDLTAFVTEYFQVPPRLSTDFNQDGEINADDLGDFISAFFAGCP